MLKGGVYEPTLLLHQKHVIMCLFQCKLQLFTLVSGACIQTSATMNYACDPTGTLPD